MDTKELIPIEIFCLHHSVEISFINSLHEFDLIEVVQVNEEKYIPVSQLLEVEKIIRLHNDLRINTEDIDIVIHLLQKIKKMQIKIELLKSKLGIHETED